MRLSFVFLLLWLVARIADCAPAERPDPAAAGSEARPGILALARARLHDEMSRESSGAHHAEPLRLGSGLELTTDPRGIVLQPRAAAAEAAPAWYLPSAWHLRVGDGGSRPGAQALAEAGLATMPSSVCGLAVGRWARVNVEWPISRRMSFGLLPGIVLSREGQGRRRPQGQVAMALHPALAADWHAAVALVGRTTNAAIPGSAPMSLDSSLAWQASDALQAGVAVSRRLAGAGTPVQGEFTVSAHF